ncbi:hypothetical protein GCM10010912_38810 [Paenibacillus albidus]|uniref:Uncharacterized protein n=1 Tax=Paenibacillus albidus TaxID=2041023 RepID=A0A917FMH8_9BACL|nr:hypothetical protein GCM10010912_38810 [Paenibacillus albidus]
MAETFLAFFEYAPHPLSHKKDCNRAKQCPYSSCETPAALPERSKGPVEIHLFASLQSPIYIVEGLWK